ncbi:hypothetical protein Sj15T_07390 [Sphingobium sp. TA15]|uniref:DUF2093 domain-containing protein n=3 Tax=Sphingobium indicum TaxID=332055 RepID=D4Z1E4_SPHIU|nr:MULTISPECIES: DUF2093 domain-containing protein [Sphingobium]EPR09470.1 hypothetical protein M527_07525 [Sphingobium indicum IP26]KEY99466.1 hypothetical protein AI27_03650 [Sphingomonas sp. BHC-A]BDD65718.1 hypothetical protein Sj15T_07390 [Sphingobium sp. TA15]APL94216.1 hypothetical protein SIDU_06670 [Sphingobium indicum B90A]EQA98661.1 hypothetical protein L286_21280 [Sphingobium sp. HDIP04]
MADIQGLAVLHYDTPHFDVVRPGQFVLCAVSGARIDLEDLKYWSAEFQEAYRGPEEATRSFLEHRGAGFR